MKLEDNGSSELKPAVPAVPEANNTSSVKPKEPVTPKTEVSVKSPEELKIDENGSKSPNPADTLSRTPILTVPSVKPTTIVSEDVKSQIQMEVDTPETKEKETPVPAAAVVPSPENKPAN